MHTFLCFCQRVQTARNHRQLQPDILPPCRSSRLFVYPLGEGRRCPPPERPETSGGRRRERRGGGRVRAAAAEAGVNRQVRQRALARSPSQLVARTARWPARLDQRVRPCFVFYF